MIGDQNGKNENMKEVNVVGLYGLEGQNEAEG